MNLPELIAQIQSQLEKLANQEIANQKEQEATSQSIENLELQIKEQYLRRSKLDDEAIQIYRQGEELKTKLEKLNRIAVLVREFHNLHHECQDNQELLQTLYASISLLAEGESIEIDRTRVLEDPRKCTDDSSSQLQQSSEDSLFENSTLSNSSQEKQEETQGNECETTLTLQNIKTALPNAELIYKQLVASNLEKYQTYQNLIIDELDVIWCSVAFIAFGRAAYRQLSFKHHPDLSGSEQAMQLINTAWEISEGYLADTATTDIAKN